VENLDYLVEYYGIDQDFILSEWHSMSAARHVVIERIAATQHFSRGAELVYTTFEILKNCGMYDEMNIWDFLATFPWVAKDLPCLSSEVSRYTECVQWILQWPDHIRPFMGITGGLGHFS